MTSVPRTLVAFRSAQMQAPVPRGFHAAVAPLQQRFGSALAAVLLYGSCRRMGSAVDGVVDMYAIVDDYASAYTESWLRYANAWLPPNVFYMETCDAAGPQRIKYAVLSSADFRRLGSAAFQSYFWARFAQPVALLYGRDACVRTEVAAVLAAAVVRFLQETAPASGKESCTCAEFWAAGFRLTYGAELRPETPQRAMELVQQEPEYYFAALRMAADALPDLAIQPDGSVAVQYLPADIGSCRRRWQVRRFLGAMLSLLRLAKATFTFSGGVDYAAWKVERHTGMKVEVTDHLRRHPLLLGWRVVWQLLRRGVLR